MRLIATVMILLAGSASAATDIDLTAPDGTALRATYHSPGKPGPGIVLLHM
jgi:hypothetical protein